VETCRNS